MSSVTCASRVSELDAEAHIAQYVTVLAHLLLWAVQRACRRFASGNVTKAECPDWKRAYAPSTAHISPFTARCSGCGSPSAPSWQAPPACKRRKASSVTRHGRHRTSPALHVTRKTRSRRLAVAPLHHGASRCTMEHHDATGVTTPRQTVKASPHRHKWMLSHGAPADPSDPRGARFTPPNGVHPTMRHPARRLRRLSRGRRRQDILDWPFCRARQTS